MPPNYKLAKISILKLMFKYPYLYQYLTDSNKQGLKSDCVECNNSNILLINAILLLTEWGSAQEIVVLLYRDKTCDLIG